MPIFLFQFIPPFTSGNFIKRAIIQFMLYNNKMGPKKSWPSQDMPAYLPADKAFFGHRAYAGICSFFMWFLREKGPFWRDLGTGKRQTS